MLDIGIPRKYILAVDEQVIQMAKLDVYKQGIDHVFQYSFKKLDCTRELNGMRIMQTIGTPYKYEAGRLSIALEYALEIGQIDDNKFQEYVSKLKNLHKRNLAYEKGNPPIIYEKKSIKKKSTNSKRKEKEGTLKGFEKPKKVTAKQINSEARSKFLKGLKLNIQ